MPVAVTVTIYWFPISNTQQATTNNKQTTTGVVHMHDYGLLHGDIAARNLLISLRGGAGKEWFARLRSAVCSSFSASLVFILSCALMCRIIVLNDFGLSQRAMAIAV